MLVIKRLQLDKWRELRSTLEMDNFIHVETDEDWELELISMSFLKQICRMNIGIFSNLQNLVCSIKHLDIAQVVRM